MVTDSSSGREEPDITEESVEEGPFPTRRLRPNRARWATNNLVSLQPIEAFDTLPAVQTRTTRPALRYEQLERARVRGAYYYRMNPDDLGVKWVRLWRAHNATGADLVIGTMATGVFRPLRQDRYRWILARRKDTIYGLLTLKNVEEMNDRQFAMWEAHNKRRQTKKEAARNEAVSEDLDEGA